MREFSYNKMSGSEPTVYPPLIIMAVALLIALCILVYTSGVLDAYPKAHFIPWVLGLLGVFAAPSVYLYYTGKFSFADPIVFASYSYFIPAFFFGGLFFALDISQPHFVHLIEDQDVTIPMTILLVATGFAGMAAGYLIPVGKKLGSLLSAKLPKYEHSDNSMIVPGIVLLFVGIMNTAVALSIGVFGYQKTDEVGIFDALVSMTTLLWVQAAFLLFLLMFRRSKFDLTTAAVIGILIAINIVRLLYGGSRGNLIPIFSAAIIAFALVHRTFALRHVVLAVTAFAAIIFGGMVYGTTFREIKGTESRQDIGQYTDNIFETIDSVGRTDLSKTFETGLLTLAERMDIVSTLAVVVSKYEQVAPYEEAYALDDNIYKDTVNSAIPRFIWNDKPPLSDPRRFSELYFDYGESSFAITPMGDLLRNFGFIGVFLGMALVGLFLRIFYVALIDDQPPSVWRMTLFFMLLISVSYESFYGTIIPLFFKTGLIAVIGIILVGTLAGRIESAKVRKLTAH